MHVSYITMKQFIVLLVLGFFMPSLLQAQSSLIFTRAMSGADLGTTGFAVGNPGPAAARVTLTLYATDGTVLDTTDLNVPPNGQVARMAVDLFPRAQVLQPPLTGGWVEGASAASNLSAFWLGGDFTDNVDGAATAATGEDLIVPVATADSELNIVNPSAGPLTMVIRLYRSDGTEASLPAIRPLTPKGSFRATLSSLFSPAALTSASHARVSCQCGRPFAASIIVRNYLAAPSWAAVNAVPAGSTQVQLDFPHVISGNFSGANYSSVLGLVNLSGAAQTVRLTFTPLAGGAQRVVNRQLGTNGGLREALPALFGFGPEYQDGWLRVAGERPLAGFIAYAESVNAGVSIFAPQNSARSDLMFAHFVDLQPWMTGIALLNTNSSAAQIEISAHAFDGSVIGSQPITLPPLTKVARLLREWIPQTQGRSVDGGSVRVRSNLPIFGMELFFTTDLRILSGIGSSLDE
jgi:hypothetical protein